MPEFDRTEALRKFWTPVEATKLRRFFAATDDVLSKLIECAKTGTKGSASLIARAERTQQNLRVVFTDLGVDIE